MGKKKMVQITVLVDDEHLGEMGRVASALKKKGFVLSETLGEVGVLTGSVPADEVTALSAVAGVSAIEQNRTDYHTQQ
jgi:hypothetical protein